MDGTELVEYFRSENPYEGERGDLDRLTTVQAAVRLLREQAAEIARLHDQIWEGVND